MRSVVCPYCERKFWVEEQAVFGQNEGVRGWENR